MSKTNFRMHGSSLLTFTGDHSSGYPPVGADRLRKNWGSHVDASHSRQPLVKGERLVRYEVNAVMKATGRNHAAPSPF